MDTSDFDTHVLEAGFQHTQTGYTCIYCTAVFDEGEIFKDGDRYFDARHMAQRHVTQAHGGSFHALLQNSGKYLSLTPNQKRLLTLMQSGMPDRDIAAELGLSASTVRHQRFTFREKAKAARHFLAVWNRTENGGGDQNTIIPIHEGATMVDERYMISEEESEKILENMFISQQPLRLRAFSPKEKKKIVILRRIAAEFKRDRKYTEKEVNAILGDIYEDFATLRRYLIEYGYMERTNDCAAYWLK